MSEFQPTGQTAVGHKTVVTGWTDPGRKDDQGKDRIELVPPELIFAVARVLTFGAKKYADRNWEKGIKWSRVFGAAMRHLWAWWSGKQATNKNFLFGPTDDETKFSHLWHAACCVAFLIAFEDRQMDDFDDRPNPDPKPEA
ncbi:MAG: dATP/dGTP diphosphohydrolase domain-containing protein [Pseudomonadota bacterium]